MLATLVRLRPPGRDAALAAALGLVVLAATFLVADRENPTRLAVEAALVGVAALALAWRGRRPITVLAVVVAAVMAYYWTATTDGPAVVLMVVAVYTVATRLRWPASVAVGSALLVVWVGAELLLGRGRLDVTLLEHSAWVFTSVAVGVAVGAARQARVATLARLEEQARVRVERERLQIAREVHDVVAHSLAMINVQAGVAAHVQARRPEQAAAALAEIREASRVALADLRATLAVLRDPEGPRTDGGERPPDAPGPGLARLAEVVRTGEAAGLDVSVRQAAGPLPAPVDAAAYRIVQEAVTNAVRHARGARHLWIDIDRVDGAVRVRVRDDGSPSTAAAEGNGLRGMVERAAALGGHAEARPEQRGFVVDAELPLPADRVPVDR